MKTVIMAQTQQGFQEYILPQLHNADYRIRLCRDIFGLETDLDLNLEIMDGEWKLLEGETYSFRQVPETKENILRDGSEFYVYPEGRSIQVTLLVIWWNDCRISCDKYDLSNLDEVSVGSVDGNQIRYQLGAYISKRHALLMRTQEGWSVYDYSTNGTFVNGRRVGQSHCLSFGDCVTLFGLRLIYLGNVLAVTAAGGLLFVSQEKMPALCTEKGMPESFRQTGKEKKKFYKSAPRTVEPLFTDIIEIENPPAKKQGKRKPLFLTIGPSFTMALPMMLGCLVSILAARSRGVNSGVFMFTGMITAFGSAIFGVIWALSNLKYAKKEEVEDEELRYNAYGEYLINMAEQIREKYENNIRILHSTYLAGNDCSAFLPDTGNLWNRNPSQEDFMWVRLGRGDLPFPGKIQIPKRRFMLLEDDLMEKPLQLKENFETMYQVPVCVDLLKQGMVGIIGGNSKEGGYSVLRNILAQEAANNSYVDVKFVFVYDGDKNRQRERWEFVKWLPHVWSEDKKIRYVAENRTDLGDICYALGSVFREREEAGNSMGGGGKFIKPHYLFFLLNPEMLEGELLSRYVTKPEQRFGITVLWLAQRYEQLPNSCEQIIQNDGFKSGIYHIREGLGNFKKLAFDEVGQKSLEMQARSLAGIEVEGAQKGGDLPGCLEFLEMYGVNNVEELNVLQRWKKNRVYESMRVPVGKRAAGQDCYLDIHEKYHGPHGLMAGTTGSGKSETLQTYILSLAVNFGPDDVNFFLIDFKGGGMANLFTDIPHLAGKISNLSGGQVRRAMVSIKSENRRRQRTFNEHGVNNINSYTRLYKNGEASEAVPHLLIIIDEFAELKREQPDFMRELISVAQVGRSLGVHLILATQKPDGTVDENIWSNSRFRICLRVQDKMDSAGMLRRPDAAYITQVGRGYLQVGNDEIFEMFQSAYSGAVYDDSIEPGRVLAEMISMTGRRLLEGRRTKRRQEKQANTGGQERTQLEAVIAYVAKTACKSGYQKPRQLWLPELPKQLYLQNLEGYTGQPDRMFSGKYERKAAVGLYDDPARQEQKTLMLDFSEGGHHAVCGGVNSGKSTFLQTAVFSLLNSCTPSQLQLYLLDFGGGMLTCFRQAPHVGGIVCDGQEDRIKRFFFLLEHMMDERRELLQGGSFAQYICGHKESLPAVIVVIDNYASLCKKTKDCYEDILLRLAKEGVGCGIYLLVSAAGFGMREIPNGVADNIKTVLALEMGEKGKYGEVLRTIRIENLPENGIHGRGIARVGEELLEFQTALSLQAEDDFARVRMLEEACVRMREEWKGETAVRIPEIPKNPEFSMLMQEPAAKLYNKGTRFIPIGYRELDASVYAVDLERTYSFLITGRNGSGKTNLLRGILLAASCKEAELVVIEEIGEELMGVSQSCNARYIRTWEDIFAYFIELKPEFVRRNIRKQEYLAKGLEGNALFEKMQQETPIFIFIADMSAFLETVYRKNTDGTGMEAFLENIAEKGMLHHIYFFGCVKAEDEPLLMVRKAFKSFAAYGTGIHLGGNLTAQRIFRFSNFSIAQQSRPEKPGSGLVPSQEDENMGETVILPVVRGNQR